MFDGHLQSLVNGMRNADPKLGKGGSFSQKFHLKAAFTALKDSMVQTGEIYWNLGWNCGYEVLPGNDHFFLSEKFCIL
jgi:hypothetical protein